MKLKTLSLLSVIILMDFISLFLILYSQNVKTSMFIIGVYGFILFHVLDYYGIEK